VSPTQLILWSARDFATRLNPPGVDGLSGLAHQATQKNYLFIYF